MAALNVGIRSVAENRICSLYFLMTVKDVYVYSNYILDLFCKTYKSYLRVVIFNLVLFYKYDPVSSGEKNLKNLYLDMT